MLLRNIFFQNISLLIMDSDNDDTQIFQLNEIFSTTKKLRKFVQVLESFSTQSMVNFSRDICDLSRLSSDKCSFFCFYTANDCKCGFIDKNFTFFPKSTPQHSGAANHVTTVFKKTFSDYFKQLSNHYDTNSLMSTLCDTHLTPKILRVFIWKYLLLRLRVVKKLVQVFME